TAKSFVISTGFPIFAGFWRATANAVRNPKSEIRDPKSHEHSVCLCRPGIASWPFASGSCRTARFSFMADTTELVPELLEAGVHFGHQTKRWNPKMKPYIFEQRNAIYIINLDETVQQLQRATEFLQDVTRRGGKILFVECKKQAQEAIKEAALACGQFYVNQRWLGGTLTNLATIRKSIGRLKYIEEIEQSPEYKKMGKQELAALNREAAKL